MSLARSLLGYRPSQGQGVHGTVSKMTSARRPRQRQIRDGDVIRIGKGAVQGMPIDLAHT